MVSRFMVPLVLVLLLGAAGSSWAQRVHESMPAGRQKQEICTDLSRTEVLSCPGDEVTKAEVQGREATESGAHAPDHAAKKRGGMELASTIQTIERPTETGGATDEASGSPALSLEKKTRQPIQSIRDFSQNVAYDQARFWTSPLRLRLSDAYWGVPLGLLTGSLIAADKSIEKELPGNPNTIRRAKHLADYGAFTFAGATGGVYLWGKATHGDYLSETGLLAGESAVSSFLASQAIKFAGSRQRPIEGNGKGRFRQGGNSFPSEHAAEAWSIATVFARRYPGLLTKVIAYGGATAVSAGRVVGRQHFSSDVLVGSALGWYFAGQTLRRHERDQMELRRWGTFVRAAEPTAGEERGRSPDFMASPYVPIDSWVYRAFDRLAAMGYAKTAFENIRPWTRLECARIVGDVAQELQPGEGADSAATHAYAALASEFASELRRLDGETDRELALESVYTRVMSISGPVLNDGYHFGQTIVNDYGRPDRQGTNVVSGFSGYGSAGMLTGYFRGEYQHSPSAPALPEMARQVAGAADGLPPEPGLASGAINRFRIIEGYVGTNLGGWQLTFGRQNLWWGPSGGGPMLFSDNAEPFTMLRFSRVSPFKLPGLLSILGPVRLEYILGQLNGHNFIYGKSTGFEGQYGSTFSPQPFIHGTKAGFALTPNLQFGFSYTTLFAGKGVPFTTRTFLKSMFNAGNAPPGGVNDPGDRRSAVDFSYRLPGLRKWLTFYADGFTEDQLSPIAYADRSAWRAGLYAPRLPALPKLDLRVEGVYTDLPIGGAVDRGFFYYNGRFRDGYTSNGNLLGSWIGRQGQGAQAWSTYWLSPQSYVQFGFRHQKVSREFIANGGTLSDFSVRSDIWLHPDLSVSAFVQYEKWLFPAIAAGAQSNVSASFQLSFWPTHWRK